MIDATPDTLVVDVPPSADTSTEPAPTTEAVASRGAQAPVFVDGARLHSTDGRVYVASHVTRHTLTLTRADQGPRRDRQQKKFEKAERRRLKATRAVQVTAIDAAVAAGERPQVDW